MMPCKHWAYDMWSINYYYPEHLLLCSIAQSCPTLCDPMDCSMPGFPAIHHLPDLLTLMSIESMMPSNHLVLYRTHLLLPSIFPSIKVFSLNIINTQYRTHSRPPKWLSKHKTTSTDTRERTHIQTTHTFSTHQYKSLRRVSNEHCAWSRFLTNYTITSFESNFFFLLKAKLFRETLI